VNPKAFKIIDGKLYLNYNSESADQFEDGAVENIMKADQSYEELIRQ
jgi:hypothetical protein